MPLALLAPGLLDVDADALARCAPLARIAARAQGRAVDDAETALLQALGCDAPPAPLAALGAGVDVGAAWIARADPVATVVTHEDVRLVARVDDLADDEVHALAALLDGHFAGDGLAFVAPRRDAWFVRATVPQAIETVALASALDRPLRSRLPRGEHAGRWRRWWTEVQMLLHEHPLAARGAQGVTALWFSGGGTLPRSLPRGVRVFAVDTRDGDVLRGVARFAGDEAAPLHALASALGDADAATLIGACSEAITDADALDAFAAQALQPALAALDRGRIDRLVLVAGGRWAAAQWDVGRGRLLDRWFKRAAPFVAPPRDDG